MSTSKYKIENQIIKINGKFQLRTFKNKEKYSLKIIEEIYIYRHLWPLL